MIRRSTRKTALWAAGIGTAALLCGLGLLQRATSAKITGGVFLFLLGALASVFVYGLLKPRDLLRVGREGIDQLTDRPRVFIPWEEITDIFVIKHGHSKNVGIKVRDPALFVTTRGQRVLRSEGFAWTLKPLLAGLQVLAEWPSGFGDAARTLTTDLYPATFEISTVGWPVRPTQLVQELRSRWVAAAGQPALEKNITTEGTESGSASGTLVCRDCGHRSVVGTSFCAECGRFLEWSGEPIRDSPDSGSASA